MMANPQIFMNRSLDFLRRNNPFLLLAYGAVQTVYGIVTWPTRVKIMKYKLMLEVEKLEKMQSALYAEPLYQSQVGKMNRIY